MINQNVIDYIHKELKKGFSPMDIEGILVKTGYNKRDVDGILSELEKRGVDTSADYHTGIANYIRKIYFTLVEVFHSRFYIFGPTLLLLFSIMVLTNQDWYAFLTAVITFSINLALAVYILNALLNKHVKVQRSDTFSFVFLWALAPLIIAYMFSVKLLFILIIPLVILFISTMEKHFKLEKMQSIIIGIRIFFASLVGVYLTLALIGFVTGLFKYVV